MTFLDARWILMFIGKFIAVGVTSTAVLCIIGYAVEALGANKK